MQAKPSMFEERPQSRGSLIRVEKLHYRYPQHANYVLSDVTLEVQKHSITAILGRSGGGKTTLFNILCGFITPTSGACYMQERCIDEPSAERIPIFQSDGLWPWLSTIQNVTLLHLLTRGHAYARMQEARAAELLEAVGIRREFHRVYVKRLSVGMKKRVELARALFARPAIILADEPFASVDNHTKTLLHDLLLNLWKDRHLTIFFSTHDLHEALYIASDIITLTDKNGASIVGHTSKNPFQGNRRAMRDQPTSYFDFYDSLQSHLSPMVDKLSAI